MSGSKSKYKIDKMSFKELENTVVLPSFQRKLVWSKAEKKSFIETLHNGYPFGSILVYRYPNEEKISLIDGLQRFTTIRDYRDNPQDYIMISDFVGEIVDLFINRDTPTSTKRNYENIVENIIKKFISNLNDSTKSLELFYQIQEYFKDMDQIVNQNMGPIVELQDQLVNEITQYLNIEKIEIPTIIFIGSDTELATVFENLNRGGKKLSKYQVFAAQWYKYTLQLTNSANSNAILERTINWYESLENDRGLEIENFDADAMREQAKINVAELCFAFGQMILEELPVFWNKPSDDTANEIGYSTMAIILNIKNKDLSNIISGENITIFENSVFLEGILLKSLQIYRDINSLFSLYLHTPGNLNDFKYAIGTNFQILSYFGALWNIRYELNKEKFTLQTKNGSSKVYENMKNNLLKWYIFDTVEGNWSGSGDSKLDQIVIEKNNKYLNTISKDDMNNSLLKWYDEQLQKKSINFEPVSKMLYTVNASFESNRYNKSKYDLEHVIPRKLLSKIGNKENIPGGTLGNLMFLDSNTNRGKKEQTMYDFVYEDTYKLTTSFIDQNFYPSKKTFISVINEIDSEGKNYANTLSAIKSRGTDIITALVKNLG